MRKALAHLKEKGIPAEENLAKLKVLVHAHCWIRGYQVHRRTKYQSGTSFRWNSTVMDITELVQECLFCKMLLTGERMVRWLSTTLHGESPTDVVHLHFLYTGESVTNDLTYMLLMKYYLRGYTCLYPSETAESEMIMDIMSKRNADIDGLIWIVSNRWAHLTASVKKIFVEDDMCVINLQRFTVHGPIKLSSAHARRYWEHVRRYSRNGSSLSLTGHQWWTV